MKVWKGYGSEHSMNLVMIGHFKDAVTADEAKDVIERLSEQVQTDYDEISRNAGRYPDSLLDLLGRLKVHSIGPAELEQFALDVRVRSEGSQLRITTDEVDVSAFLKVLIDKGARVEVYSAHYYPEQSEDDEV